LGEIPLEEGPEEFVTPFIGSRRAGGKIGSREAATKPQPAAVLRSNFIESESPEFIVRDPAGEGLRSLAKEIRGSTTQDEKPRRHPGPVDENPKNFEQPGLALDFVDHDEAAKVTKGEGRLRQPGLIIGIFEIEIRGRPGVGGRDRTGESGFSYLTGPDDPYDGMPSKKTSNRRTFIIP
jgi:hypothetical protein